MALPHKYETGAALFTGLVLVSIMAMLGTSAAMISATDQKLAANTQQNIKTFHAAQAGVESTIAAIGNQVQAIAANMASSSPSSSPQLVADFLDVVPSGKQPPSVLTLQSALPANISAGLNVKIERTSVTRDQPCTEDEPVPTGVSSQCDFYRITSRYTDPNQPGTAAVIAGVVVRTFSVPAVTTVTETTNHTGGMSGIKGFIYPDLNDFVNKLAMKKKYDIFKCGVIPTKTKVAGQISQNSTTTTTTTQPAQLQIAFRPIYWYIERN